MLSNSTNLIDIRGLITEVYCMKRNLEVAEFHRRFGFPVIGFSAFLNSRNI